MLVLNRRLPEAFARITVYTATAQQKPWLTTCGGLFWGGGGPQVSNLLPQRAKRSAQNTTTKRIPVMLIFPKWAIGCTRLFVSRKHVLALWRNRPRRLSRCCTGTPFFGLSLCPLLDLRTWRVAYPTTTQNSKLYEQEACLNIIFLSSTRS